MPDATGEAGDIQWNFEKFLIGPDWQVAESSRRGPSRRTQPLVSAIEASLPA